MVHNLLNKYILISNRCRTHAFINYDCTLCFAFVITEKRKEKEKSPYKIHMKNQHRQKKKKKKKTPEEDI